MIDNLVFIKNEAEIGTPVDPTVNECLDIIKQCREGLFDLNKVVQVIDRHMYTDKDKHSWGISISGEISQLQVLIKWLEELDRVSQDVKLPPLMMRDKQDEKRVL